MMEIKKRVAIIGAGPSGLCAGKSALEDGLEPTIFEKGSKVGGLWSPTTGKMWDNLVANVPQGLVSFSDYQFSKELPTAENIFPNQKVLYNYLYNYAKEFNVLEQIKFNSNVIKVERIPIKNTDENQWRVTWLSYSSDKNTTDKSETKSEIYDFLIVSSGVFSKPQDCKQLESELKSFSGKISYSEEYKNVQPFRNKKVIVVGTSFSGCEIAAEISTVTSKCIQVGHDNLYVLSRLLPNQNGKLIPWDHLLYSREKCYEFGYGKTQEEVFAIRKQIFLSLCPKQNKELTPTTKIPITTPPENEPNNGIVISSTYVNRVEDGSIQVYSGNNFKIQSSNSSSITFKNDLGETYTEDNIDEIILANGFQLDLSYLESDILQDINYKPTDSFQPVCLYNNILAPNFKSIAFISLIKGVYFPEIELLARWSTLLASNKLNYPNKEQLEQGVKVELEKRNRFYKNSKRPQFPVSDVVIHCDKLATEIGCKPDFESMKVNDPELYNILWKGVFCPSSYRLVGQNSKPDLAKSIISHYIDTFNSFNN